MNVNPHVLAGFRAERDRQEAEAQAAFDALPLIERMQSHYESAQKILMNPSSDGYADSEDMLYSLSCIGDAWPEIRAALERPG